MCIGDIETTARKQAYAIRRIANRSRQCRDEEAIFHRGRRSKPSLESWTSGALEANDAANMTQGPLRNLGPGSQNTTLCAFPAFENSAMRIPDARRGSASSGYPDDRTGHDGLIGYILAGM